MHQMAVVGQDAIHNFVPQPGLIGWRRAKRETVTIDYGQLKLGRLEQRRNRRVVLRVGIPPRKCEIEERHDDYSHYRHRTPSAALEAPA